eukprot:1074647-Pleurochrysis_carterae.AAC.1
MLISDSRLLAAACESAAGAVLGTEPGAVLDTELGAVLGTELGAVLGAVLSAESRRDAETPSTNGADMM